MIEWFNTKNEVLFGKQLANFFRSRIAKDSLNVDNKKDMRKVIAVTDKVLLQISNYKLEHKLNVYKIAKMGNTFKWSLIDAGYDPTFVSTLTKKIIASI